MIRMNKNKKYYINQSRYFIYLLCFFIVGFKCNSQTRLIELMPLKKSSFVVNFNSNPYKILSESAYFKGDDKVFFYETNFQKNFCINYINTKNNNQESIFLELDTFKYIMKNKEYELLKKYGFTNVRFFSNNFYIDFQNTIYRFSNKNSKQCYKFDEKFVINDTILYDDFKHINDSLVLLFNNPPDTKQKVKSTIFLYNSNSLSVIHIKNYYNTCPRAGYINPEIQNRYDVQGKNLVVSDNINYNLSCIDLETGKETFFKKNIGIDTNIVNHINNKIEYYNFDSVGYYLASTPRIFDVQFLNDTLLMVNFSIRKSPTIDQNIYHYEDSKIDILKIKNNKISIFKENIDDSFAYFDSKAKPFTFENINPYLRFGNYYYFINNKLVVFSFNKITPNKKYTLEKYIKKSKNLLLNLKCKYQYAVYEFTTN